MKVEFQMNVTHVVCGPIVIYSLVILCRESSVESCQIYHNEWEDKHTTVYVFTAMKTHNILTLNTATLYTTASVLEQ